MFFISKQPETTTPMDDEDFKYRLRRNADKGCQPGDTECLKKVLYKTQLVTQATRCILVWKKSKLKACRESANSLVDESIEQAHSSLQT